MNECVYNSLNKEQKNLFGEFMRDLIIDQINVQVSIIKASEKTADGASDYIFNEDNKLVKHTSILGFPKDWEHKEEIIAHQYAAVSEIQSFFSKLQPSEKPYSKKCKCSNFKMELQEVRALFEESLISKYCENYNFRKIVTNEGLKYKDSNVQLLWEGFLLFGFILKSIVNPVNGEVMQ